MARRLRAVAQRRSSASDGAPVTGDVCGKLLQMEEGEEYMCSHSTKEEEWGAGRKGELTVEGGIR
jgi:hypothetical protein